MILLDGRKVKKDKILELKEKVAKLDRRLGLAIIQVGNDSASAIYVRQKEKLANELGYYCKCFCFDENILEEELIMHISKLNMDDTIDGIIVELPLPLKFHRDRIINAISFEKDIDGLTSDNVLSLSNNRPYLIPCTPKAILDLLEYYKIDFLGKRVVVIGKSILVGMPFATILRNKNVDVTVLDSKTLDVSLYTKSADIVVIAIGKKYYLSGDMVKKDAIIIDVGINLDDEKVVGDVDFVSVSKKASFITPVPGGIGPMTLYEAMNNVYLAYMLKKRKE